jgi:AP-3 complex subunit beta
VANAVVELKSLVQTQMQMQGASHAGPSSAPLTIVERLAYRIDEIRHAQARACIVWLVGQYAADDSPNAVIEGVKPWAPDVLRKIAKSLRDEARGRQRITGQSSSANILFFFPFSFSFFFFFRVKTVPVKLQAVTLAAKLLVLSPAHDTLVQLAKYVFALARYDRNYDVRDRGRMLQQLLAGAVPGVGAADAQNVGGVVLRRTQVRVVLFEGKENAAAAAAATTTTATQDDDAATGRRERLGTLGLVLGRDVMNARLLPDWLEHGVESSLRASPDDAPAGATSAAVITAFGHVAGSSSSSRPGVGSGGHSTPIVVLTPADSGGPSPVGSVPNKSGWTDLDKFYESESEEDDDEEGEEEEDDDDDEDQDGEGDGESEDGERSGEESDHQSESGQEKGAPRTPEEKSEGEDIDVEQSSSMAPVL